MTVDPSAPTLVRFVSHACLETYVTPRAQSRTGAERLPLFGTSTTSPADACAVRVGFFLGPGPLSGVYVGL